jgi:hypothetical protein
MNFEKLWTSKADKILKKVSISKVSEVNGAIFQYVIKSLMYIYFLIYKYIKEELQPIAIKKGFVIQ